MRRATYIAVALCIPALGAAQGYRLRVDTRGQSVAYRGIGDSTFVHAIPISTTADLTMWGFGVSGLRVRTVTRLTLDASAAGGGDDWPGTQPAALLLEGYGEYASDRFTAQLGRQDVESRLGFTGFDGARVAIHDSRSRFEAGGYAGWGLARAIALPVTSAALNPLDEYRPQDRQLVAGVTGLWSSTRVDVRANYLREVDPRADAFVSERAAIDVFGRPLGDAHWTASAGADYDIAAGLWGSAEARLRYTTGDGHLDASAGVRRYRPHFDLWTIWGAFSPVPYNAVDASAYVAVTRALHLRARGEAYEFDDTETATPLVTFERSGWRFSSGASWALPRGWTVEGGYHAEFGPGAASRGLEGAVSGTVADSLSLLLHASTLDRPLEFRFSDATLTTYGASVDYRATSRVRIQFDASGFSEKQETVTDPVDWDQLRLSARVVLLFGRGADVGSLPAAIQRMPDGQRAPRP